jgi:hypothetical protein
VLAKIETTLMSRARTTVDSFDPLPALLVPAKEQVCAIDTRRPRDLRLDFFRGLALFCMFIDHVQLNGLLALFTVQAMGISDAAEMFVLISGCAAGMVYGRVLDGGGLVAATMRIYRRACQLYVAHAFLLMQLIVAMVYWADSWVQRDNAGQFPTVFTEPATALFNILTLRWQPDFMDILPLYIALLAALPLVLLGFRNREKAVLAGSLGLWFVTQFSDRIALTTYPTHSVWYFNPFAWQALFVVGAWCGWRGIHQGIAWLSRRWVFWLAVAVVLAGFAIRFSWTLHRFYGPVPALLTELLGHPLAKTNLSPLRFANILALALVVVSLMPAKSTLLRHWAARPFIVCGRHSLPIFCLSGILLTIEPLLIYQWPGGFLLQSIVVATGILMMVAAATLLERFDLWPHQPKLEAGLRNRAAS